MRPRQYYLLKDHPRDIISRAGACFNEARHYDREKEVETMMTSRQRALLLQ
jgi:hypothetical protein